MTRYLDLAVHFLLAEQVTGTEAAVLAKACCTDLADWALHAPSASFGGEEFYPDVFDKGVVLAWPGTIHFSTGRARGVGAIVLFVDLNLGTWDPDPPDVDEAEEAMLAVAAHEVDEIWLACWLRDRVNCA